MHRASGPLFLVVSVVLCACGGKEAPKADSAAAPPPAAASLASYDATTHTATLHAKDYAFDAPDSLPAGWTTFHLVNDGPNIHHAQIVRLDSGKTVADMKAMKPDAPPPPWMVFVGGPNAPDPKSSSDAAFNLEPGNYAIMCLVDTPDKVPHFMKGMVRPLKVTAASGTPAAEPTSDMSVALSDYSFDVKTPMTAGKHTVKITNNGPQMHELELIRLEPGKTVKEAAAFLYDTTAKGPPPLHGIGGVAAMSPKTTAYATFDLGPGNYVLLCFVPAPDGKPHFEKGMMKEFTLK